MTNLNDIQDFNKALRRSVELGIFHVTCAIPKLKQDKLICILINEFDGMQHRRFHATILYRAYGLAFINKQKMEWVKQRGL